MYNMRHVTFFWVVMLTLSSCLNNTDKEKHVATEKPGRKSIPRTTIQWLDSSKSLGKVTEGEMIKVTYRFINSGKNPLIIENAQASCGCTVADYPKNPIPPGGSGEILATFNSTGRVGTQKKNLTVYANTDLDVHPLWFDLEVVGAKK